MATGFGAASDDRGELRAGIANCSAGCSAAGGSAATCNRESASHTGLSGASDAKPKRTGSSAAPVGCAYSVPSIEAISSVGLAWPLDGPLFSLLAAGSSRTSFRSRTSSSCVTTLATSDRSAVSDVWASTCARCARRHQAAEAAGRSRTWAFSCTMRSSAPRVSRRMSRRLQSVAEGMLTYPFRRKRFGFSPLHTRVPCGFRILAVRTLMAREPASTLCDGLSLSMIFDGASVPLRGEFEFPGRSERPSAAPDSARRVRRHSDAATTTSTRASGTPTRSHQRSGPQGQPRSGRPLRRSWRRTTPAMTTTRRRSRRRRRRRGPRSASRRRNAVVMRRPLATAPGGSARN